jgi:hypothetical protein
VLKKQFAWRSFNSFTPVLTNTINLLLGSAQDSHIRTLFGDAKNAAELQGFVYEALRAFISVLA